MPDKEVKTKLTLQGDSGGMISAMQKAEDKIKSFDGHMAAISGTAGKLVGVIGMLAGVGSMGALVKSSIDAADNMSKLSQKVGVNIEQLSGMAYAAELADVSAEQLGKGMGKLAKAMYEAAGDPNSGPAKTFKELGVSVTDSAGKLRNTDAVMMDVAGRMAGMTDGARKTALAMEVFGKSGADLIPLLNSGKEGIKEATDEARRFGLVLSAEAGRQAEEFNDNLTRLKSRAQGAATVFATELMPSLISVSAAFVNEGAGSAATFAGGLREIIRTAQQSGPVLGAMYDKIAAWQQTGGLLYHTPAQMAEYKRQTAIIDEAAGEQIAAINRALDEPPSSLAKPKGRGGDNGRGKPGDATGLTEQQKGYQTQIKDFLKTAWDQAAIELAAEDFSRDLYRKMGLTGQGLWAEKPSGFTATPNLNLGTAALKLSNPEEEAANAASLTKWATIRDKNRQEDLSRSAGFFAMQMEMGGNTYKADLFWIDQERQEMEYNWAMNTDSFTVYEQRMTQITAYYEQQRTEVKRAESQKQLGLAASGFGSMATIADAFYQLSGKKSKEAFKVYQVTKSTETGVTTHSAAMKAYDSMVGIPFIGPTLAVAAATAAYAAGAVAIQGIWSGSAGGSVGSPGESVGSPGGGASSGNGFVTQPVNQQATPQQNIEIHLNGTTLADPQALTRWTEDYFIPTLKDLKTRGVTA